MAQRRSSRKSKTKPKAKSKSTAAAVKSAAKKAAHTSKIKAKAKRKSAPKVTVKARPKAAKPGARRTARAVQGRKPQRKAGGRRQGFNTTSKAGKLGVETRPQDMDVRKRDPGFVYEEEPRQSADESFSPGNYEPGQVGEPKMAPRRRGVANRGGDSETESPGDTGSRAATDGSVSEEQSASRDHGKAE